MSTDVKDGAAAPANDEIKNLKAEFTRKLTNLETTNAQMKTSQDALLAEVQKLTKPAAKAEDKGSLSDLMYRDPDAYAARIAEEADKRADARVKDAFQKQNQQQQMIGTLVDQYPELQYGDHEVTVRAVAIFNGLSNEEKSNPTAYKQAVLEAANEFGLKPRSKRPKEEEYVGGGGGSGAPRGASARKKAEIDPATKAFAEHMGLDLSKPEVKERLATNHGRETYNRWK